MLAERAENRSPGTGRVYRLVKTKRSSEAWTGAGAFRFGGRWNRPGSRMVYGSRSVSLALLEVLVHLNGGANLPELSILSLRAPAGAIETLPRPPGGGPFVFPFRPGEPQAIGTEWLAGRRSAFLAVPSAIVPNEENILINPNHPDFHDSHFAAPIPFRIDGRLGASGMPD